MGVPSFYRWLVDNYPKIVVDAIEGKGESTTDPNRPEFDNLYLDMNGIIHPCFHPEEEDHTSPPTTFQEVFDNIYEYIDRLFAIVRPQKLLFLAIDGVAPRAKMNQQRSRRFRTSKDNEIAEAEERRLRRQFEIEGKPLFPKQESETSDSNIITPGTVFMHELSKSLLYYIDQRLLKNAAWKDVKVILSDANVPGEGEHKIMMFIRLQRASPGYNPNTRHCLYGLDADLIMLALATHEVHFSILREDVLVQLPVDTTRFKAKPSSYEQNHSARENAALAAYRAPKRTPYQFLHLWLLREYLELDMKIVDPPENMEIDLERLIDDFIFICFFTGNDFLPHMPTLEIHEGSINLLMHVYKQEFKNLGGYLVDMQRAGEKKASYVKLKRVEKFILSVGAYEDRIFKKRTEIRERRLRRLMEECKNNVEEEQEEETGTEIKLSHYASADGKDHTSKSFEVAEIENSESSDTRYKLEALQNMKELKQKLKKYIRDRSDLFKNGSFALDKVRLGMVGWRERYYKEKFDAETKEDRERTRKEVVQKYTEGLCWVLLYYFSGVPSWNWFYPYHYSPFASDLRGLSQVKVNFLKGSQFKPFDQLMAVLPPRSGHALPRSYKALMNSEESDLIDFYPSDFELDEEGKRFTWQAICKLPFIAEDCLLCHTKILEQELQDDEVERNSTKFDVLYVSSKQELGSQIVSLYEKLHEGRRPIDTDLSGMSGFISPRKDYDFAESNLLEDCKECQENNILCVSYELPNDSQHFPRPLEGVNVPKKTITEKDIAETKLWHEIHGNKPICTRPQHLRSNKNATEGANSSSSKSFTGEIHKGAGSGWGRGRGMLENNSSDSTKSFTGEIHKGAGSGWGRGRGMPESNSSDSNAHTECSRNFEAGRGGKVTVSSSSSLGETRGPSFSHDSRVQNAYRGSYNNIDKWKSSSFGQYESRGMENLRISDSQRGFNCPGRAQSGSSANYRTFRNNSVENRNFEWRPHVQPSAALFVQHGDGQSGHSGQHGVDRWSRDSAGSTNNAWGHNQSPLPSPSMPGRGRGRYLPKATPMDWKLRDTMRTSSSDNLPRM
ncbi:5'-3' exoribonuclease 3-like isoform X2 [Rhododendron vialii]|uniref:5'-3' exoribonuclease 3-like isoform X2 n=1 Tax=Rhododendron vialii TaxID=182163 RepID=UPI00265DFC5D|nr:5'-3' exoribonuclease 3-like isoform X2 [Rhododendron vialii]